MSNSKSAVNNDMASYETKCRRCGNISEWFLAFKRDMSKKMFLDFMLAKINTAAHGNCRNCEKYTVQDYVSFHYPEG